MYDFGLTTEQFYRLTHAQFLLLSKRHREHLAHREMCSGFTTSAVINYSMLRPEDPISAIDFMPNHVAHKPTTPPLTDEELKAESDYNVLILREALRQRAEMKKRNDG